MVGINPARGGTRVRGTLARLAGWMDVIGLRHWSFVNCISSPGPYTFKDVDFDTLGAATQGYDKVVCLGGFPSRALRTLGINHHVLPHPSGLNRNLNDPEYERQQVNLCKEYIYA